MPQSTDPSSPGDTSNGTLQVPVVTTSPAPRVMPSHESSFESQVRSGQIPDRREN